MNFRSVKVSSGSNSLLLMALAIIFLIAGCKVKDITWIDNMLSEMETAWISADKAGQGSEGRDAAANAVAKKHFRPGMTEEEAFTLLRELQDKGFEIRESRHEGARAWPDKTILPWGSGPYPDAATTKGLQLRYAKGASYFDVSKMYGRERVIIKKTVWISFKIADDTGVISAVEATLSADSI